jgi:hypothetical protein
VSGPFYTSDPELLGHSGAYRLYTSFAAGPEEAGLVDRFPPDSDLRHIVIELLAERSSVENVVEEPHRIEDAIVEARSILDSRRDN